MDGAFPHPSLSAIQAEGLTIFAEEASEVAQECSKTLRSGADFCRRGKDVPTRTHLMTEIVDFMVLYGVVRKLGLVDETVNVDALIDAKIERLKQWSNLDPIAQEAFA